MKKDLLKIITQPFSYRTKYLFVICAMFLVSSASTAQKKQQPQEEPNEALDKFTKAMDALGTNYTPVLSGGLSISIGDKTNPPPTRVRWPWLW